MIQTQGCVKEIGNGSVSKFSVILELAMVFYSFFLIFILAALGLRRAVWAPECELSSCIARA